MRPHQYASRVQHVSALNWNPHSTHNFLHSTRRPLHKNDFGPLSTDHFKKSTFHCGMSARQLTFLQQCVTHDKQSNVTPHVSPVIEMGQNVDTSTVYRFVCIFWRLRKCTESFLYVKAVVRCLFLCRQLGLHSIQCQNIVRKESAVICGSTCHMPRGNTGHLKETRACTATGRVDIWNQGILNTKEGLWGVRSLKITLINTRAAPQVMGSAKWRKNATKY